METKILVEAWMPNPWHVHVSDHISANKLYAILLCPQKFIYNVSVAEHQFNTLHYLAMYFKKLQPNTQKKNCGPEKFKTARPGTNESQ
jgi:hypothetical protein